MDHHRIEVVVVELGEEEGYYAAECAEGDAWLAGVESGIACASWAAEELSRVESSCVVEEGDLVMGREDV